MLITPANLNLFFTGLETRFNQAFTDAPIWHQQVVTIYPSLTEQWLMGWMGMLDKLRQWKGARQVRTPAPQTYGAKIDKFELTEGIDVDKLADDTYGIYSMVAADMGMQSAKWPDFTVRDLIEGLGDYAGAQPQTGTDGLSHWNSAHPVDYYDASKGIYPNDYGTGGLTVNGITVGGAFSVNAWATVWQDMASRKNESGEKLGLQPDLSMVPTQLGFAGKVITQSAIFAPPVLTQLGGGLSPTAGSAVPANAPFVGAMDNPLRGQTDLFINFDLNSAAAWYMLTTRRVIKPFGWVLRQAGTLTTRNSPTDPSVFDVNQMLMGVKARGVPVWSLPWLSSRSGV